MHLGVIFLTNTLKNESKRLERMAAMSLNEDGELFINVNGLRFRTVSSQDLGSSPSNTIVVLFHGASFSIDDWKKIGTMDQLTQKSIPYLAVDLPRGKASKSEKREYPEMSGYVPLLEDLFRASGIGTRSKKMIIVGPSMGGAFALQYALERQNQIAGLVLIAPSLSGLNRELLENLDSPVLLIWGDKDNIFPVEQYGRELKELLPRAKLLIIKGARHPAYLDKPSEFHDLLLDFVDEVSE